ncbi:kinesin-like protein KIN-10B [Punica granatum]|uniref:Kinesin-like protein n=2 Tax=Punica granatum TaxID=22663 RepID=A0A218XC92_PUNGR|nr:kinesin-like protein KIN-10B [Punica granatum]OWM82309.1 hypothetical protein CDL15_Pgr001883 [Punica granatum]PKI62085.1 hypothetical protein CRG98_017458 [Punica granatum]
MEASGATANFPNNQQLSVSKVRVVVRVRPFLPHEIASRNGDPVSCLSVLDQEFGSPEEVSVYLKDQLTSRSECYKLDSFYGQEDNNVRQIFDTEVRPLIPGIFEGCNATVFAYGATGSGKTYTMQGTDELPGLMPSAMSVVLSMCESDGSTVEISYYEVYMDRCYDLLEAKPKEIVILDDKDGQIHLKGLSQVPVKSMSDFHEAFSSGIQKRKVAHTGLNDVSSRSHGALVISVRTSRGATGKLNLIDLAGNEDNRRTCNEGIRIQESGKINQSLFALSNVIYALNNKKTRVPYRESKLTRILQDSLGGTSRALMVACLNPGEYQESVHTVSLAARSRHVSNFVPLTQKQETPKLKVDMEAKLRAWLESRGKTKSASRFGAFVSSSSHKCPDSASSAKMNNNYHSSMRTKASMIGQGASATRRAIIMPKRNLFDSVVSTDLCSENLCSAPEVEKKDKLDSHETTSKARSRGEPLDEEEKDMSSPVTGTKKSLLQSPLRKALSPINSNLGCKALEGSIEEFSCLSLSEAKTPTVDKKSCTDNVQEITTTPLNKFNECSSHLRANLIKEYIFLLNTASREELLELKGIGPKRAEYILEVRETSPLKSLNDLEKIGLSSKQVHEMFRRAARSVF